MASFVETHGHALHEDHFEALYSTYKSDVQRLASYLLKNASDAEDAAQTVFLNVLRALRQGVTPTDPRAWLLAITRNVCFSRHRAAAARPVHVELEPDETAGPSGDETPSADEIVGALARLLPNQRTALILRDFRGVSRAEICNLMSLSPVAVEALLTRARNAFREELEAGEQPFACDETRKLVEAQLDGLITVADRHSLRSHLRHCGPCSTLARAVRSSRGKVAGLIFGPVELVTKLASAFSQAPTAVHVAAALTSTAAVATVAIPAAVSNGPSIAHVEGRTAPGPARAAVVSRPTSRHLHAAAAAPVVVQASNSSPVATAWHAVTSKAAPRHVHARPAVHHAAKSPVVKPRNPTRSHSQPQSSQPQATQPQSTQPQATEPQSGQPQSGQPQSGQTQHGGVTTTRPSSGGIHTMSPPATASPSARPSQPSGITSPHTSSPPRSASPAARPTAKPMSRPRIRPKPARKSPRRGKEHHAPAPSAQVEAPSQPPASALGAPGGASSTAGSGSLIGPAASNPAVVAPPTGAVGQAGDTGDKDKNDNSPGGHGKSH